MNYFPDERAGAERMKTLFVEQLQPCERMTSAFLVRSKEVKVKKSGEPYLSLMLGDRTGEVDAKMWENVEEVLSTFERDDFVRVRGAVQLFRNRPQIQIHKIRKIDEREIELGDYLPATREDVEQMFAEVHGYVEAIRNPPLRQLVLNILDDAAIQERYKRAPAAKSLHHAFFGGLLEHVRSLCRLARLVSQNYPGVDIDLLTAGVVLHDLGKIYELSYERSFAYTTEGQLLGHMILVLEVVHRHVAAIPEFPRNLQILLEHLIISHHGKYEFGSPKLPMFPEALLLHYIDDLDSKMHSMLQLTERERQIEQEWTGFNPSLERPILKLERFYSAPAPLKAQGAAAGEVREGASGGEAETSAPRKTAGGSDSVPVQANLLEQADLLQRKLRGEK